MQWSASSSIPEPESKLEASASKDATRIVMDLEALEDEFAANS